ncbi:MAG: TetR family transcriptional regulator [Marinomonas sp.]
MARRSDIALSQGMICDAALAIIEESGLDSLTMRSLARGLEIQAPSLYAHYRDKSELISAIAVRYFMEARDAVFSASSAEEWAQKFGFAFYSVLISNRDAARLFALSQPPVQSEEVSPENAAKPLTDFGLSIPEALEIQAAVISLSLGMALDHSNTVTSGFLSQHFVLEDAFRSALKALAEGLVARDITTSPAE